jgi:hypothetical protein
VPHRVGDRIGLLDARDAAVVLEVVGVAIAPAARIEAHEREVGEEQLGAGAFADVEPDAVVGVPVDVVIAFGGAAPGAAIGDGQSDVPAHPVWYRLAGTPCVGDAMASR